MKRNHEEKSLAKGEKTIDNTTRQARLAGRMSTKVVPCWYVVPDELIAANPGIAGLLAGMMRGQEYEHFYSEEKANARKKELEAT